MRRLLAILLLATGLVPSRAAASPAEAGRATAPVVTMLYGTDRFFQANRGRFTGKPGSTVHYGRATVVLDSEYPRQSGHPTPWLSYTPRTGSSPERVEFSPLEARAFDESVSADPTSDLFVFIHGFNTDFEAAVQRAAHLAYDLQLPGTPILFSWPSRGTLRAFRQDTRVAGDAEELDRVAAFLTRVLRHSGARRVHLIAHSLGTRILCGALARVDDRWTPRVASIVLISPEIGADAFRALFEGPRGLRERFVDRGCPVVAYVSARDEALRLAVRANREQRLGEGGARRSLLPGLTTIDASRVSVDCGFCHAWDDRDGIINDLYLSLGQGLPPSRRLLTRRVKDGLPYYEVFDGVHRVRHADDYNWALATRVSPLVNEARLGLRVDHPLQFWLSVRNLSYPNALDVRWEPRRSHWRPFAEVGFTYLHSRGTGPVVSGGAMRYSLGLQYVWDSGWGMGAGLDVLDSLWENGPRPADRVLRSLLGNEGFPGSQVHFQLTKYFFLGV